MATAERVGFFAALYPTLRPHMTFPRDWGELPPFPFNQPSLRYYYMARNGIYALGRLWNLGDEEVLFPAYCHGIEIEALSAAGVRLQFYPVHSGMRIDVDDIRKRITSRTRAVYVIHYAGFPGPIEQIAELCRDRGVQLIEDCALALLSCAGTKPLGSFGDAAVFNLYKALPVPNGGALLLRDSAATQPLAVTPPPISSTMAYTATAIWRHLRFEARGFTHRLLKTARSVAKSYSGKFEVVQVGSEHFVPADANLAMSRICHWILAAQNFSEIVACRRRNYQRLLDRLKEVSTPVFAELPPGVSPLFYPLRARNKMAIIERLFSRGIDAGNYWSVTPPGISRGQFPEVDEMRETIVEVPCHQDLSLEAMDWIAEEIIAMRDSL